MEIASSVDLFALYAYWGGSMAGGRAVLMWCRTSLSRHFMITGVNAIAPLRDVIAASFGTGTIVDVFRQVGTVHFNREGLNILVNTSPSSAAQSLRTRPGIPSGPAAFRVLILSKVLITSAGWMTKVCLFAAEAWLIVVPVLFTSKRLKNWLSCSASEVLLLVRLLLLFCPVMLANPLSCPAGVQVAEIILDFLPVVRFCLPDALL